MNSPIDPVADIKKQQVKDRVSRSRNKTREEGGVLLSGQLNAAHANQLSQIKDHLASEGFESTQIAAIRFAVKETAESIAEQRKEGTDEK